MNAIRIRTQISQDNELILKNLPLSKGKRVGVIILEDDQEVIATDQKRFPLRGKTIQFDNPFDPATGDADWEAAR